MAEELYEGIKRFITGKSRIPMYAIVPRKYRFFVISVEEGTRYGSILGEIPEEKPKRPALWKRVFFATLGWAAGLLAGYFLPWPSLSLLGFAIRPFVRWITIPLLSILGAYLSFNYDEVIRQILRKKPESRFINLAISTDSRDLRGLRIPTISLENYLGERPLRDLSEKISIQEVYEIYKTAWDREVLDYIKFLRRINLTRIGNVDSFLIVCMVSPRGLGAALSLAESIKKSPHFRTTGERIYVQLIWPSEKQRPHLAGILAEEGEKIYNSILQLEGFVDAIFHADEEALSGYRRFAFIKGAKKVNRLQRAYEIISTLGDKTTSKPADFDASLTSKGGQRTPHLTFCIDDLPTDEIKALEVLATYALEVLQVPLTRYDVEKVYLVSCYLLCSPEEYHLAVPEALKALEKRAGLDVMMVDAIEEPESKSATTLEVISLPRDGICNLTSLLGRGERGRVEAEGKEEGEEALVSAGESSGKDDTAVGR